jgi:hypothetical protein
MTTTSTFLPIDIGSAPNDGSGNSIRDAFNKVNFNFLNLYEWAFGTTSTSATGIRFIDLLDTPKTYTTGTSKVGTGPILVGINNAGNGLTNRILSAGSNITLDTTVAGTITISSTAAGGGGGSGGTSTSSNTLLVNATTFEAGSTSATPNTVAARDPSGNIYAVSFIGDSTHALAADNANTAYTATNALTLFNPWLNIFVSASTGTVPNTVVLRDSLGNIAGAGGGGGTGTSTSTQTLAVDGVAQYTGATFAVPNTIPARDSSAQLWATYFQGTATSALVANLATLATNATNATNATSANLATTATNATNIVVGTYVSGTYYPTVVAGTGNQPFTINTSVSMNAGTVTAVDFASTSDAKLKDVVSNIPNALDKVNAINGVLFRWNDLARAKGIENTGLQLGVLAQEVEAVAPEAIIKVDDTLTVNYDKLVPILIEAIKELNRKIDSLTGAK